MINLPNRWTSIFALAVALAAGSAGASTETDASTVVARAENLLWGKAFEAHVDMAVTTPSWARTISLRVWMERPAKSFLRVIAPAKDAGISSLRIGTEMWNYIPAIERTIKIPPSLMLQPWLGSDFTNDDLVKESSLVTDYTHRLLDSPTSKDSGQYVVEALPKPNAPVVWGKIIYTVRADFIPLRLEYFDERGRPVRALVYSDIRTIDDREVPTRWEMKPADKPGKFTVITIKSGRYDKAIDSDVFSLRNLTRKD